MDGKETKPCGRRWLTGNWCLVSVWSAAVFAINTSVSSTLTLPSCSVDVGLLSALSLASNQYTVMLRHLKKITATDSHC